MSRQGPSTKEELETAQRIWLDLQKFSLDYGYDSVMGLIMGSGQEIARMKRPLQTMQRLTCEVLAQVSKKNQGGQS